VTTPVVACAGPAVTSERQLPVMVFRPLLALVVESVVTLARVTFATTVVWSTGLTVMEGPHIQLPPIVTVLSHGHGSTTVVVFSPTIVITCVSATATSVVMPDPNPPLMVFRPLLASVVELVVTFARVTFTTTTVFFGVWGIIGTQAITGVLP